MNVKYVTYFWIGEFRNIFFFTIGQSESVFLNFFFILYNS